MREILHQTDVPAPKKRQLLSGIFCWLMFDFGFLLLFQFFFDTETMHGIFYCQIAVYCASFLLTVLCFRPFLLDSMERISFRAIFLEALKSYGYYYLLTYAASFLVALLELFVPTAQENLNQEAVNTMLLYEPLPMILCVCVLVPVTEECLVRGMIFAPLCRKKPFLAYLISSTVFSVIHVISSIGYISAMNAVENIIIYLPSGLVLGRIYQKMGTILAPIVLHCTINIVSVVLTFAMY